MRGGCLRPGRDGADSCPPSPRARRADAVLGEDARRAAFRRAVPSHPRLGARRASCSQQTWTPSTPSSTLPSTGSSRRTRWRSSCTCCAKRRSSSGARRSNQGRSPLAPGRRRPGGCPRRGGWRGAARWRGDRRRDCRPPGQGIEGQAELGEARRAIAPAERAGAGVGQRQVTEGLVDVPDARVHRRREVVVVLQKGRLEALGPGFERREDLGPGAPRDEQGEGRDPDPRLLRVRSGR